MYGKHATDSENDEPKAPKPAKPREAKWGEKQTDYM